MKILLILLLAGTIALTACGGGGNSAGPDVVAPPLSGNWQFTVASPDDHTFLGGLQGGFLVQKNGALSGAAVYSVMLPPQNGGPGTVCNSGSAPITGTLSGQNVTLTAVAGTQTFTFTGTVSTDHTSMIGTYDSTDGAGCGTAQSKLQWSAKFVPPVFGAILGNFHSTAGLAGLINQNFPVTGFISQGPNIGASNATITGSLNFIDPVSLLSVYPCFGTASVTGQISGTSIILQIIGDDGANLGQIGGAVGSGIGTVTFDAASSGAAGIIHSIVSPAYAVNSKRCSGVGLGTPGDAGSICLSVNSAACQQPVTLAPSFIDFPTQLVGAAPVTQTITVTNNDPAGSTLNGLQFQFSTDNGSFGGPSDFTGLPNFTEHDTCAPSLGAAFSLTTGQSCTVSISFSSQESCPWLPFGSPASVQGAAPAQCPLPLRAQLALINSASVDNNTTFVVPISGTGTSAIAPSTPELDFGAQAVSQVSLPQQLSFTNRSNHAVQILPLSGTPCTSPLPRPLEDTSPVSGLQVVANGNSNGGNISAAETTIFYNCDLDSTSHQPNFQISSDTCTGTLLAAQTSCSLQIAYAPQAHTNLLQGLDYFLQLNTLQCTSNVTTNCEIDGGRFPVELKANPPSSLRMSPGAGLDFGIQPVGKSSDPKTITLFNDPNDPNAGTVTFTGNLMKGDYSERDDCGATLAPGASCTLTITFKPGVLGLDPGTLTITYGASQLQTVFLRGTGQ